MGDSVEMLGTLAVSKFNNFDVGNLVSGIMEIERWNEEEEVQKSNDAGVLQFRLRVKGYDREAK